MWIKYDAIQNINQYKKKYVLKPISPYEYKV
jgi:hypothetical protein